MKWSKKIIKNWPFLSIMLIGIIALAIQMLQVVMYADDYSVGIYSTQSISDIANYWVNHYLGWGGGYTAVLVIALIAMGPLVWKTAFIAMVAVFVALTTKMICHKSENKKWIVASILWLLVFTLSIWVSREVLYWLDGGMAYLFSMFQVFILFYFLFTRMVQGVNKKYDKIFIPIIAFFAGWSSAQSGCISALLPIAFIIWKKFFNKDGKEKVKINKLYYVVSALSIVGFAIFYFAPGNSARMDTFELYSGMNIFEKLLYRSGDVINLLAFNYGTDFSVMPLFFYMTSGILAFITLRKFNKKDHGIMNQINIGCALYSLGMIILCVIGRIEIGVPTEIARRAFTYVNLYDAIQTNTFSVIQLLPYVAAILLFLTTTINAFYVSKREKNPFVFFVVLFGLLSQAIMVMSPYSPLRTTFYTTAFMWMALAKIIATSKGEDMDISPIFMLVIMAWNFYLGLFSIIIYYVIKTLAQKEYFNIKDYSVLFVTMTLAVYALPNYAKTVGSYYLNKKVDSENISRIIDCQTACKEGDVLYLVKPRNELYGFTGLSGIDWVEEAVKDYYKLPKTVDLKYEGE